MGHLRGEQAEGGLWQQPWLVLLQARTLEKAVEGLQKVPAKGDFSSPWPAVCLDFPSTEQMVLQGFV